MGRVTALATLIPMLLVGCAQRVINGMTPADGYTRYQGIDYGEQPRQALDVYVPDGAPESAPVVVFFYGGGWREGERGGYRFVGQALASQGYVVVIPDYRLYPQVRFPAFVEDGARAVAWTRRHIAGYGGDPGTLFVMGHSAGAHLAAMLALDRRYLAAEGGSPGWLSGMVGLAGPYDFLPFRTDFYRVVFEPEAQFPDSQPVNFVDGSAPPMLLLQGLKDAVVAPKNTRSLAQALEAAGAGVQSILYERQSHMSIIAGLAKPLRATGPMLQDIVAFLRGHTPAEVRAGADASVEH